MPPLDSNALLPYDYSWAQGGPIFKTSIVSTAAGKEQRNADRWDTMRVWRLRWEDLKKSDLDALLNFFKDRKGRFQSFLFRRPYDLTDIRARFNQDSVQAEIDSGADQSRVEFELIEIHPGYADVPPTTFPADSGVEISNSYGAVLLGGSSHSTTVYAFAPGIEKRTTNRPTIRKWQIEYGGLTLGQLNTLEQFFVARKGQAQTFLFKPPGETTMVKVRFGQDEFNAEYYLGQTGAVGSLQLVEVL